jgi:hypothetical protein
MALRDNILASLRKSQPDLASTIAQEAPPVNNRAKQAQQSLLRRSHYADQTDHLVRQRVLLPGVDESDTSRVTGSYQIIREMQSHTIPTKKFGKKKKLTRQTSLSFNALALKGVPGSSRNGFNTLAAIDAEHTGTHVVDTDLDNTAAQSLLERLQRSPKNCDTTKGNYIV